MDSYIRLAPPESMLRLNNNKKTEYSQYAKMLQFNRRLWAAELTDRMTMNKRIASIPRLASAHWIMIENTTIGIYAACAQTRIETTLVGTSSIQHTIRANNTFWVTGRRTANVAGNTRTNCLTIDFTTLAVRATRRRVTGVLWLCYVLLRNLDWSTLNKCVSFHSIRASTSWNVIHNCANGI